MISIIFGEWLGLNWIWTTTEGHETIVELSDHLGSIRFPDVFFRRIGEAWLAESTLPPVPLPNWDSRELSPDICLAEPQVPVLFGEAEPHLAREGNQLRLPLDIFGATFFMLSRYEEAVCPEQDTHGRFPAAASLAGRAGFISRPIIDEYVEILWAAMKHLWPGGPARRTLGARTIVSCDVDNPFAFTGKWHQTARRLLGDLLKRRAPGTAIRNLQGSWHARRGHHELDPYWYALDWIMDVNEAAGRPVAFYFIPENTDPRYDQSTSLDDPRMRDLLRRIHGRGHEIGVHPGYHSHTDPAVMARSIATLRRVLEEEDIVQPQLGGRQHFLRWETPTTARLWEDNGLDYDSTLGFAEQPGFRCGTCREYPLYDLEARRPLRLRERPLILMESSVIAERYLGLGHTDAALHQMQYLRRTCHRMGGDFTLLWHNSHLGSSQDRAFYQSLIEPPSSLSALRS